MLKFKVLSYMWGSPERLKSIKVNGQTVHVRENLFDFLRFAQSAFVDEPIWIDQLCIDQQSAQEKNHEVSRIGEIFASAETTLVWLGRRGRDRKATPEERSGAEAMILYHLQNPYWTRLWIVQEIIRSTEIVLCDDHGKAVWTEGSRHAFTFDPLGDRVAHILRWKHRIDSGGWPGSRQEGGRYPIPNWEDATTLSRGAHCELLQDRIYGLMGLVDSSLHVDVDYMKSVEEVFIDVALIELNRDLTNSNHWRGSIVPKVSSMLEIWQISDIALAIIVTLDTMRRHSRAHRYPTRAHRGAEISLSKLDFWALFMQLLHASLMRHNDHFKAARGVAHIWFLTCRYLQLHDLDHQVLPHLSNALIKAFGSRYIDIDGVLSSEERELEDSILDSVVSGKSGQLLSATRNLLKDALAQQVDPEAKHTVIEFYDTDLSL